MNMKRFVLVVVFLAPCCLNSSLGQHTEHESQKQSASETGSLMFSRGGTGEVFLNRCKPAEASDPAKNKAAGKDAQSIGFCFGFIGAVLDLDTASAHSGDQPKRYCVPENVSWPQLARIVSKYGNDHPDALQRAAIALVGSALRQTSPCQ